MPTKPYIRTLTNSSVDVLNAIRNEASTNYQNYVPVATADPEVIRTIGATIMDFPSLQNEFLNALVNRIGKVIITSKSYSNPWARFKKGFIEMGETIEDIFVNIASVFEYNPEEAEQALFKREIPDVRSTFYVMNFQKFYKATVSNAELRRAFLSINGVTDLISKVIESMYTAMNYDEFLTMKYMLARRILDGKMFPTEIPAVTATNMNTIVSTIKGVSNSYTFLNPEHNIAGVYNHTPKDNQILIVNALFDATMDVEVLASAFNMDKAQFMGQRVMVDSFGSMDTARLAILFADDPTYNEISQNELNALDAIPCLLVDEDFFQIYDNLMEMKDVENAQGLYWNYLLHAWKTFAVSPYSNNALFIPATPAVSTVTVSPSALTMKRGQSASFSVNVTTSNFAPMDVNWTTNREGVTINKSGVITVPSTFPTGTTSITVTATSVFDPNKSGTATITLAT